MVDPEVFRRIDADKGAQAIRITGFLEDLSAHLKELGLSDTVKTHIGRDIHSFFELSDRPSLIVHLQLYPGMSNNEVLRVFARVMDRNRLEEIQLDPSVSIGNEHRAVVFDLPSFAAGVLVPWDCAQIATMILRDLESLPDVTERN